ncbi:MAG: retroviral-like aspartic protease family protein [Allosphingosinicella sp.]
MKRILGVRPTLDSMIYLDVAVIVGANKCRWVSALIDTGASHTILNGGVSDEIELVRTPKSLPATGVVGGGTAGTVWVKLGLVSTDASENPIEIEQEIAVLDGCTEELLLGMDVLKHFDLAINRDGSFSLSWE